MASIRLADLAQQLNAELHGEGDIVITGGAAMHSAKSQQIPFLSNRRYREQLAACTASAGGLTEAELPFCTSAAGVGRHPYLTYALTAQIMDTTPAPAKDIAPSAGIDATAQLGNNVSVGAMRSLKRAAC